MTVHPADLLLYAGGACLERYGRLWRVTQPADRLGEELVPSVTRATTGWTMDRDGKVRAVAAGSPRVAWYDLDGDGVKRPCLLVEGARTNLVTESEDISAWTPSGTPVVTDDQVDGGAVKLARVEDDDGAVQERVEIGVTFTGDGIKALAFYTYPDSAGEQLFILRDSSAAADRLYVTVTWTANVPSAVASTGQVLQTVKAFEVASGVYAYRIECATASVTAANTNVIRYYPAGATASNTGVVFFGGVQAEDNTFPSSYIPTDGGTATRNGDDITIPFYLAATEDLTIHAIMARPNHAGFSGTIGSFPGVYQVGGSNPAVGTRFTSASRDIGSRVRDAVPNTNLIVTTTPAGSRLTITVQYDASVPSVRQHLGSAWSSWATGSAVPFAAYGSAVMKVGFLDTYLGGGLYALLVARGSHEPSDFTAWLP